MAEDTTRREWRSKHHTLTSKQFGGGLPTMQMSSKRSRMFALGCIALVSGTVGATITGQVFAYRYSQLNPTAVVEPAPAEPQFAMSTVLVATRDLRFGDKVDSSTIEAVKWIAGTEPKGSFATLEEFTQGVESRAALAPIEVGEPVLAAKVTGPGERPTLSALVEDNMRALTIAVDEVFGVAGFVLPGDRVDVMLTRSLKPGDSSTSQADVLVQNVKVLAIDQQADQRLDSPSVSSAVTLEVDSEMAQKLALGGSIGRLSLALRAAGSAHRADVGSVSLVDLTSDVTRRRTMTITRGIGDRPGVRPLATAAAAVPVPVPANTGTTE